MRYAFWVFILSLSFSNGGAQELLQERNLRLDWTFYKSRVLPFLDSSGENPYAIHLLTSLDIGKKSYLSIDIPAGTSLFIDSKFIRHYPDAGTRVYSIDSLRSEIGLDSLYLTLYNDVGFDFPPRSSIGFMHSSFDTSTAVNPVEARSQDQRKDYLKIIMLLVFTFFVVMYSMFPSELRDFYSLGDLFTFRFTDTYLTKFRNITKTQILVIIFQTALLASIMLIAIHYYHNPLDRSLFVRLNPVWGWLIIFAITLIMVFLKYLLITIVSHLFGMHERINFYFIEYLRMAMIFYSLIFLALVFVVVNHFYSLQSLLNTLMIIVIIFNFLRFGILYLKFQRNISIKKIHLFSYLCSTELIPIVIGLNFFLK